MSANPGNKLSSWSPAPPERGSFPLDHAGECTQYMQEYLKCMKIVKNNNAPNCRMLAKNYLNCRMDHDLMDKVSWDKLGLPEDTNTTSNTATPKLE